MMKETSTFLGISEAVTIALAYALGWISGLVILLLEKNNHQVRYHAAQSVIIFGGITILNILVPIVTFGGSISVLLLKIISLATIVIWIVFVVTALNKKPIVVEAIKDYSDKLVDLVKLA